MLISTHESCRIGYCRSQLAHSKDESGNQEYLQQGGIRVPKRVAFFKNRVRSSLKGLAGLSRGLDSWEFPNL